MGFVQRKESLFGSVRGQGDPHNCQIIIKRSTLYTDYTDGGLRVTDIDKYIDAIKNKLGKKINHTWKKYTKQYAYMY